MSRIPRTAFDQAVSQPQQACGEQGARLRGLGLAISAALAAARRSSPEAAAAGSPKSARAAGPYAQAAGIVIPAMISLGVALPAAAQTEIGSTSSEVDLSAVGPSFNPFVVYAGTTISTTGSANGIYGLTGSYTLSNAGTIQGGAAATGIRMLRGALVTNSGAGLISGGYYGIQLAAGGSGLGTVSNQGTITGTKAIQFNAGGTVTNSAGVISGSSYGLRLFGASTVTNTGSITGTAATGVYMYGGGTLTNSGAASSIKGGNQGVFAVFGPLSITNDGTIAGTSGIGKGVYLLGGGSVTNSTSGSISGVDEAVLAGGAATRVSNAGTISASTGPGVAFTDARGTFNNTLINGGLISGGSGVAVQFGNGNNLLELDPGASFAGSVEAGAGTNTMELAAGTVSNVGTISGIGAQFTGFSAVTVDAGADWVLSGANTVGALTNAGTLTNTGALAGTPTLSGTGVLSNSGTITGSSVAVASVVGSAPSLTNSGVINSTANPGSAVYFASNGTVTNAGGAAGISGPYNGVVIGGAGTVSNQGTITGAGNVGVGVNGGGRIDNTGASALISGFVGIYIANGPGTITNSGTIDGQGTIGIDVVASQSTIVNSGTIEGGSAAVSLVGDGNLVELQAGTSLSGGLSAVGTGNGLQLDGSGSTASAIVGFAAVTATSGAAWTLSGALSLSSDLHVSTAGGSQLTVSGSMTGAGSLTKTGAGTLILAGANAFTGGTTISAGTLEGDTTSLQGTIVDNAALIFDQGSDGTFSGTVSGTGSLIKAGAGTLILDGSNSYTGASTVQAGTLEVGDSTHPDAEVQSDVAVGTGGTLRGHGTVGGDVVNDGIVWAGGSVGTLTIRGNYTQNADGALSLDITPSGASQLLVLGTAHLGGTLNLIFAPGTYTSSTLTLVKAGAVSGTFSAVDGTLPASFTDSLTYTGTTVDLALKQASTTTPPPPVLVAPADGTLYGDLIRAVSVTGQQTLISVLDVPFAPCDSATPAMQNATACASGLWAQYTGANLSLTGPGGFKSTGLGLLGGAEHALGDFRLGVEGGINQFNGTDPSGGYGRVDSGHAGVYADAVMGSMVFSGTLDGMRSDYHFQRASGIGVATSAPSGSTLSAAIQAAWPLSLASWQVTPKVGALYQHQALNGFSESIVSTNALAGDFRVNGSHSTYEPLQPYVSAMLQRRFAARYVMYIPQLSVGYRYDLRGATPIVNVTAEDGTLIALPGDEQGRGLASVGARITAEAGASWSLYVDYAGLFGDRLHDNAVSAGFVKHF